MEIKSYNSKQLNDLICSEVFKQMPVVPISSHRAISHIHNPRADTSDILMIIAYENNEMIGYLGVLADRIYNSRDEAFKCGWLSCMWVNPVLRGKGIAKKLLATAFEAWDNHILVTEFTPEAKGLYDRSGNFSDLKIIDGLRCYLRFNLHEVLPKKNEKYKTYTSLLGTADRMANMIFDLRFLISTTKSSSNIRFISIKMVDQEIENYIITNQKNQLERRNANDLNWITDYPWLIESKPTEESKRYHFSSVSERFYNLYFKIVDSGVLKGYLHFTIRDNHLKIPYAYFEPQHTGDVIKYIYKAMTDHKLNMLTVYHTGLVNHFKINQTPFIYKRPIKRHYIISKALDVHFHDKSMLSIQDGDADCAFT